ncbi:hypothetical protein F4859DRAFT_56344 [Xylaria cf. heliscus]|nr:hypothetical protein F4859DRAFT_56344 [Xylaria cf. heliscus]
MQDSPLSTTANVAGILTFVVAILAAAYVRIIYLHNSDQEYFQVKTSLAWYGTESEWLVQLVKAASDRPNAQHQPEYQIYNFVMDDLLRLEKRILELVDAVEDRAGSEDEHPKGKRWAIIPQNWRFTTAIAVAWLPIRAQALELVRQREALTARVSFTQISMIASRIRDLEHKTGLGGDKIHNSLRTVGTAIENQKVEIYRLEDLLYRTMHRDQVSRHGADSPASAYGGNLSGKSGQNDPLEPSSPRRRAMSR